MFKEYYKKANDDIRPNRELIDEIFNKAEKKTRVKAYRYGLLAAAAVVLVVSVFSFDAITNFTTKESEETSVVSTARTVNEAAVPEKLRFSSAEIREEVWTVDDYVKYLGADVRKIELPDDVSYIESNEVKIIYQDGEISSDVAEFCYEGRDGRSIKIRTSKLGMNSKMSQAEYITSDKAQFEITVQNVAADELKQIINEIRELQKNKGDKNEH